jgi:hypothetical protein
MPEINLNQYLRETLTKHKVNVSFDDEFIYAQLPTPLKLKARAIYNEINGKISSQLDVMIITPDGEKIIESFGDIADDVDTALERGLTYFNISDLHPILAAFGIEDPSVLHHLEIEEWEVDGKLWTVYLGNLIPKTNSPHINPPDEFFNTVEKAIYKQKLTNQLHWFRSFYLQHNNEITFSEFLMDNEIIMGENPFSKTIPILPDVDYYSCRNFIILKQKSPKKSLFKHLQKLLPKSFKSHKNLV